MRPMKEFRSQPPEFWALVKFVSQLLKYSTRKTQKSPSRVRRYTPDEIVQVLRDRNLDPDPWKDRVELVARYSECRADLLESIEPLLMDRDEAAGLFREIKEEIDAPEWLIVWNKQKGEKRHENYLASIVNLLTYRTLTDRGLTEKFGRAPFDHSPRGPLTFSREGMPLRTLFRWMDGAYPELNHPIAAWEVKEYYGTTTFGSRVADGVYETALDGYELNDLREAGVNVEHYLFLDGRFTWWECGKSYLCRIVDMLHADLLDGAFFGREVIEEWPAVVAAWPEPSPAEEETVSNPL